MSAPGTIYGCIFGGGPVGSAHYMEIYEHNQRIINELPAKVDLSKHIYIARNTFAVPMPDWGAFYRNQMIHFGGSFNHFQEDIDKWLDQFESLLGKLYWWRAHAHMEGELWFDATCDWGAESAPMFREPPEPISSWHFSVSSGKLPFKR